MLVLNNRPRGSDTTVHEMYRISGRPQTHTSALVSMATIENQNKTEHFGSTSITSQGLGAQIFLSKHSNKKKILIIVIIMKLESIELTKESSTLHSPSVQVPRQSDPRTVLSLSSSSPCTTRTNSLAAKRSLSHCCASADTSHHCCLLIQFKLIQPV